MKLTHQMMTFLYVLMLKQDFSHISFILSSQGLLFVRVSVIKFRFQMEIISNFSHFSVG